MSETLEHTGTAERIMSGPEEKAFWNVISECHQNAKNKGWWSDPARDTVESKLLLVHSEVSEAVEDYRVVGADHIRLRQNNNDDGDVMSMATGMPKPMGFAYELADIVIRVFDLAGYLGIDLWRAIRIKMAYNTTRPQRHGGKVI